MQIAAIVPHLKQFGGVRRFISIGNALIARGHRYTLHSLSGLELAWTRFDGGIKPGQAEYCADALLIGDPPSFGEIAKARCPAYIWVIAGGSYTAQYKAEEAKGRARFLLNNRAFLKEFPDARLCEGGVDTAFWTPKRRRVGYYAGRGQTKGEQHIVRSLSGLESVSLVPIQGLDDRALLQAYRSLDCFVSWEQREGWSNPSAEALACGVPVVTNGRNCEPFSDRVIMVEDLRRFFADPMADLSWGRVAQRLEQIWKEDGIPG